MVHKSSTRNDTAALLRECLRIVEDGSPCEISIVIAEDGKGRFSIVVSGRAHTLDGADDTPTVEIKKEDE